MLNLFEFIACIQKEKRNQKLSSIDRMLFEKVEKINIMKTKISFT